MNYMFSAQTNTNLRVHLARHASLEGPRAASYPLPGPHASFPACRRCF